MRGLGSHDEMKKRPAWFHGSEQDGSDPAARIDDLLMRWCPAKRSGAWTSTNGAFSPAV